MVEQDIHPHLKREELKHSEEILEQRKTYTQCLGQIWDKFQTL